MATATTKKTRRLLKKEVMFTSRHLHKLDLDIIGEAKEEEAVELHVACYPERQALSVYMLRSDKGGRHFV